MKKLVVVNLLFIFYSNSLFGQISANMNGPDDLYNAFFNLFKQPSKNQSNIILNVQASHCFGSRSFWNVEINKEGENYRINFFNRNEMTRNTNYASLLKKVEPDTSYILSEKEFLMGLDREIKEIRKRPIFLESNYKFTLQQGNSKKDFAFQRGEGFYYLFRYNKLMSNSNSSK